MPPQAHADDTTLSDAQAPLKGFDLVFGLTGPDAGKPALATRTPKPQKPACTVRQAEAIYAAYPRRVGKRVALVAIQRAVRRLADEGHADPVERLTERTTAYAASPAGQHPLPGNNDYRPYPATWFNHDRFDDDPDEWSKPNGEHNRSTIAQSVEGNSSPQRIAAERRAQQAQREYGEHIDVPEL